MLGWEQMKLEAAPQNRSIWVWHRMEGFPIPGHAVKSPVEF